MFDWCLRSITVEKHVPSICDLMMPDFIGITGESAVFATRKLVILSHYADCDLIANAPSRFCRRWCAFEQIEKHCNSWLMCCAASAMLSGNVMLVSSSG